MNFKGLTSTFAGCFLVVVIFSISQASEITSNPNLISMLPGKTYTLSVVMKTENLTNPGGAWVGIINDGWTWSKRLSAADETGKWRRVTISFTPIPSLSYQVVIVLEPDISGKVWFDSLQLEEGDKATEYRFAGRKRSDNWFRIDDPLFEELLTQEPEAYKSHLSPFTRMQRYPILGL